MQPLRIDNDITPGDNKIIMKHWKEVNIVHFFGTHTEQLFNQLLFTGNVTAVFHIKLKTK